MAPPQVTDVLLETVGENTLPGHGPVNLVKRPVRTRMQGVVGAGGLKPPATRLAFYSLEKVFFFAFVYE